MDSRGGLPRLGLVATDALRVAGLEAILADEVEVVLLAEGAALETEIDMVLIDASATDHLIELLGLFRQSRPEVKLIVLGAASDLDSIKRVIGAGAKGYLNDSVSANELRMAIAVVQDGSVWAPRKVLARLLASSLSEPAPIQVGEVRFTRREQEVLRLLVRGHGNREIALAMGVEEAAVKAHMGRLMRKAAVGNRTALSMRALERRWVVA